MTLNGSLNIALAFGCVAGALTAVKLAREAWQIWGPNKTKELYSPELRAQMERNDKAFSDLRSRTAALLKQDRSPA